MNRIESYLVWAENLRNMDTAKRLMSILRRYKQGGSLIAISVLMQHPKKSVEKMLQALEKRGVVKVVYVYNADNPRSVLRAQKHLDKGQDVRSAMTDNKLWTLVKE